MFRTEDGKVSLALTPDSITLTTIDYQRWENFAGLLKPPLKALLEIFKPSFFNRVGLRYSNAIDREKLGVSARPWSQLLSPVILGELSIQKIEAGLMDARRLLRIQTPDGGNSLLFQHGLGVAFGHPPTAYVIDFDFYSDRRTETDDASKLLDKFHRQAGRAFRWCLGNDLHELLEPVAVGNAAVT